MTLRELRTLFIQNLRDLYEEEEILVFFYLATEKWLHKSKVQYLLNIDNKITKKDQDLFGRLIEKLKKEEPIQYILGETFFYDYIFKVNTNVLIPRPETEELVRWVIKDYSAETTFPLSILDIGTGSGCIAISLAKRLNKATVSAIDISEEAIILAKCNAKIHNQNVQWIQQDVLTMDALPAKYDIIVSNPPYVRNSEKKEMKNNVLNYEPGLALFVDDKNPLLFYKKIAELGLGNLANNGSLYFEINQYLGNETLLLMEQLGYRNLSLKKDIFGNDRFIKAVK